MHKTFGLMFQTMYTHKKIILKILNNYTYLIICKNIFFIFVPKFHNTLSELTILTHATTWNSWKQFYRLRWSWISWILYDHGNKILLHSHSNSKTVILPRAVFRCKQSVEICIFAWVTYVTVKLAWENDFMIRRIHRRR